MGNVIGEYSGPCTLNTHLYTSISNQCRCIVTTTKDSILVPTEISIPFQWESVDRVGPSISSRLYIADTASGIGSPIYIQ